MIDTAREAAGAALNFVFPPICQICREQRASAASGYVCEGCRGQVRWVEAPFCAQCGLPFDGEISMEFECGNCQGVAWDFAWARSAARANVLLLDVIHRYKYSGALWFEPFLAGLLIEQARDALKAERWDWIVPAPLHPVKMREREFNQASRLARRLGAATGIPVNERWIRRTRFTATQTALTRDERMLNVNGAFAFCGKDRLRGASVVVVDDVMTTGATTNACAAALRAGGAGKVSVWTVARGA